MKSDPEITVFHSRVTNNEQNNGGFTGMPIWMPLTIVGAIAATVVVVLVVRRKRAP
jgi:hypothetical protein